MMKLEICSKDCDRLASICITPIANSCNDIAELNLHVNEDINVIGFRKNGLWIPVSCCLPYEKYFCTLRYLANQFFPYDLSSFAGIVRSRKHCLCFCQRLVSWSTFCCTCDVMMRILSNMNIM